MNTLPFRIAQALEEDIRKQNSGLIYDLGESWDDFQEEAANSREYSEDTMINIAMRFWEEWSDAAQHDWLYYDPMTEEKWLEYAGEIVRCLRAVHRTENEKIVELFLPKPRSPLLSSLRRIIGMGT